jgi:hypothetical protein
VCSRGKQGDGPPCFPRGLTGTRQVPACVSLECDSIYSKHHRPELDAMNLERERENQAILDSLVFDDGCIV